MFIIQILFLFMQELHIVLKWCDFIYLSRLHKRHMKLVYYTSYDSEYKDRTFKKSYLICNCSQAYWIILHIYGDLDKPCDFHAGKVILRFALNDS